MSRAERLYDEARTWSQAGCEAFAAAVLSGDVAQLDCAYVAAQQVAALACRARKLGLDPHRFGAAMDASDRLTRGYRQLRRQVVTRHFAS